MKKVICILSCLSMMSAYADTVNFTYFGNHSFISAVVSPYNLCYPPNPPEANPYSNFFAPDKCYHQFRSTCDEAQLLTFDSSTTPNQTNNANFYNLCNTSNITQTFGPEFVLWVDPANTSKIDACILLANSSPTVSESVEVNVFYDTNTTPNPNIHAPGCLPNEVALYPGQTLTAQDTFTIKCVDVLDSTHITDRISVIPNLQSYLNNHYVRCPGQAYTRNKLHQFVPVK